ncbi:putative membrane protein [Halospina denitrificans]|uniref:Putative membrane protein n=1 Tax=Halospina denitrificans TaxID=332522 RepID=A0A4R7K0W6_9GAMM|nr:cytochrome c oxidase assembly protein [Halospina denitrificans]TDT44205.1 putative membrane protein [Halospina denitrificans]
MSWFEYLLPYDFSPLTLLAFLAVLVLYIRGLRALPVAERPGVLRVGTFLLGVLLCYAVMHTRFDYYSQYMFFVHRGQHLVLHHLGPMLIALSNPLPILRYWGNRIPQAASPYLAPLGWIYRVLQQPFIAAFLFVGLIYFWLWPSMHFDAMLSRQLYWVMNWSMLLDGLLFWWLIFDPRSPYSSGALSYGMRILLLILVIVPQQVLGAWIVFNRGMVYDVYEVCGRAWPMAPETDQLIGGILTWIPPSMMSGIGVLIILGRLLHDGGSVKPSSELNVQGTNA